MSTTTINKNDKVKVEIEGTVYADMYGSLYVMNDKGESIYLTTEVNPHVKVTKKAIKEPPTRGTIVRLVMTGQQYVKTSLGWQHIDAYNGILGSAYPWTELVKRAGDYSVTVMVDKLIDVPGVDNIYDLSKPFKNTDGTETGVYVKYNDNSLCIGDRGKRFTKNESIRLARAILAANGLEA